MPITENFIEMILDAVDSPTAKYLMLTAALRCVIEDNPIDTGTQVELEAIIDQLDNFCGTYL